MTLSVATVAAVGIAGYSDETKWTQLCVGKQYKDCHIGILEDSVDKCYIVSARGTKSLTDAIKDFESVSQEYIYQLGSIACGFFDGTPEIYADVVSWVQKNPSYKLILTGHSLGAAQMTDLAAYAAVRNLTPFACVLMGSPKPGSTTLNHCLTGIPHWYSFRNGIDPVPLTPLVGEHYQELIKLNEPPPDGTWLGWHSSDLYLQGICKDYIGTLLIP